MTTPTDLTLHQLFSPAFPVGAFAWSHGAEAAIAAGWLHDRASVEAWLCDMLDHGAGWTDAVALAQTARGTDLSDLMTAMQPSPERRRESLEQGAAFAACARDVFGVQIDAAPYPVAVGKAVAALDLPLEPALRLYLQALTANITSACVRAIPLGQTDGQRLTAALGPRCAALAAKAIDATEDDIGGFVPLMDIAAQRHAGLETRIFRS